MPDQKLIRDSAGSYYTADDRFAVTKEGTSWWIRDSAIHDELGMARVSGPFGTLDAVRQAIAAEEAPSKSRPEVRAKPATRPARKPGSPAARGPKKG